MELYYRSAIMTFHLALVENPQDSLVVWTFATILYRGTSNNAVEIAKQNERVRDVQFIPEIHTSINPKSDEEILEEVSRLASLIKTSANSLTSIGALEKSLGRYGNPPSSRMVSVISLLSVEMYYSVIKHVFYF